MEKIQDILRIFFKEYRRKMKDFTESIIHYIVSIIRLYHRFLYVICRFLWCVYLKNN
jgi:hypothetical protein